MKQLVLWIIGLIEKIVNTIILRNRKVEYDPSLVVNGIIKIYGHGNICIGKNVRINSKESANPGLGCYPQTVFSVPTGKLVIGNNVGMSNVAITCTNEIVIDDNVLIGGGVKMYDTDFHSLDNTKRGKGREIDIPQTKAIHICQDAFIGANTIILKGVTIGKRAIIGAGSVVTKSVPDDEIWAGNPAKKIR